MLQSHRLTGLPAGNFAPETVQLVLCQKQEPCLNFVLVNGGGIRRYVNISDTFTEKSAEGLGAVPVWVVKLTDTT